MGYWGGFCFAGKIKSYRILLVVMTQKMLSETIVTEKLILKGLSLAVYREVAAHLRQVAGVEVKLESQQSQEFDYHQSQIGAMILRYAEILTAENHRIINDILAFYGDRHGGQWTREKLS